MKSIVITLAAGMILLWSPASALADDASKNAKIEEMMQLTHVDRMLTQMLPQMQSVVKAQMAQADLTPEQRQQAEAMQQK